MKTLSILQDSSADWRRKSPASPSVVAALLTEAGLELPNDYLTLLRFSNGGEGELGIEPRWFMLWPAEDVMELNRSYRVAERLPGCFGFGSSGGGEMLAFDMHSWRVVMIPFIGSDEKDGHLVAENFAGFIRAMGHPMPET